MQATPGQNRQDVIAVHDGERADDALAGGACLITIADFDLLLLPARLPYRLQMRMRAVATVWPIDVGYGMQQLLLAIVRQGCSDLREHRFGGTRQ